MRTFDLTLTNGEKKTASGASFAAALSSLNIPLLSVLFCEEVRENDRQDEADFAAQCRGMNGN